MAISLVKHPPTFINKKKEKSPLTGDVVSATVNKNFLDPLNGKLKFRLKQFVKKTIGLGILTPNLYFEDSVNFGFFPRVDSKWLDDFYIEQGIICSYDEENQLSFGLSTEKATEAKMIHDFVISNVGNKQKFRSIIDFGAGTGWMAKRLADLNIGQVIAVDHSIDAMKYIPRISDKIKISSLSDFFGSDKKFDYLVSVDTFEHLNDPIGMLQQLHSKAANGGIIFLSVPNFCSFFSKVYFGCHPYYEYPAHLNYFSIQSLSYAVEKAGFKVLAAKTITFPFEQDYIAKNYPRTMVFETGKELKRKLSVEGNGERLFLVAKKF